MSGADPEAAGWRHSARLNNDSRRLLFSAGGFKINRIGRLAVK